MWRTSCGRSSPALPGTTAAATSSNGVGSALTMHNWAPCSRANRGMPAAGYTWSELPTMSTTSAAVASACALRSAGIGRASPKRTTVGLRKRPPQAGHAGGQCSRFRRSTWSRGKRVSQSTQVPAPLKLSERTMVRIGLGVGTPIVEAVGPVLRRVFPKGIDVGHLVRVEFGPEPTFAAKVWDAALHRDARTGEGDAGTRVEQQRRGLGDPDTGGGAPTRAGHR